MNKYVNKYKKYKKKCYEQQFFLNCIYICIFPSASVSFFYDTNSYHPTYTYSHI